MQDRLEQLAGGIVLAITLLDVLLTVLYARAGTGLLAPALGYRMEEVDTAGHGGRGGPALPTSETIGREVTAASSDG